MEIDNDQQKVNIHIAVDCIIFGFDGNDLKVWLIKRAFEPEKGKWSLLGGFIQCDETADDAATRVLQQLTGVTRIYLEQLYTFSDIDRDSVGRVISIAYFALVNIHDWHPSADVNRDAEWFPLNRIPPVIFDHEAMIEKAKDVLRRKVANQPIGFELLPDKFTLQQLRALYEAIYDIELDKRNFIKKILSLGVLNRLEEKENSSAKKKAFYYIFDHKKYKSIRSSGVRFINAWD